MRTSCPGVGEFVAHSVMQPASQPGQARTPHERAQAPFSNASWCRGPVVCIHAHGCSQAIGLRTPLRHVDVRTGQAANRNEAVAYSRIAMNSGSMLTGWSYLRMPEMQGCAARHLSPVPMARKGNLRHGMGRGRGPHPLSPLSLWERENHFERCSARQASMRRRLVCVAVARSQRDPLPFAGKGVRFRLADGCLLALRRVELDEERGRRGQCLPGGRTLGRPPARYHIAIEAQQ